VFTANRPAARPESEEEFLRQIQQSRSQGAGREATALLPSVDEDPDRIPKLELDAASIDIGVVPNDSVSKHHVKLYNRGKRSLTITDIQTSCPCTMGYLTAEQATIPPGGEVEMEIHFD